MGFYGSRIPPYAERIPLANAIVYREGNYAVAKVWNEQWGRWSKIAKSTDHTEVWEEALLYALSKFGRAVVRGMGEFDLYDQISLYQKLDPGAYELAILGNVKFNVKLSSVGYPNGVISFPPWLDWTDPSTYIDLFIEGITFDETDLPSFMSTDDINKLVAIDCSIARRVVVKNSKIIGTRGYYIWTRCRDDAYIYTENLTLHIPSTYDGLDAHIGLWNGYSPTRVHVNTIFMDERNTPPSTSTTFIFGLPDNSTVYEYHNRLFVVDKLRARGMLGVILQYYRDSTNTKQRKGGLVILRDIDVEITESSPQHYGLLSFEQVGSNTYAPIMPKVVLENWRVVAPETVIDPKKLPSILLSIQGMYPSMIVMRNIKLENVRCKVTDTTSRFHLISHGSPAGMSEEPLIIDSIYAKLYYDADYANIGINSKNRVQIVKNIRLYAESPPNPFALNIFTKDNETVYILIDALFNPDGNVNFNTSGATFNVDMKIKGLLKTTVYAGTLKLYKNSGTAKFSGDGTTTQFIIPHKLVSVPSKFAVTPGSADAAGDFYITVDDTNIYVNYLNAPPSGTNNVILHWYAEV